MRHIIITFALIFLLFSNNNCTNSYAGESKKKETPKALADDASDIRLSSKDFGGSSGNLVEDLYEELADNNGELKNLDRDIAGVNRERGSLQDKFNVLDNKSNRYYMAANTMANNLRDSVLKRKVTTLISNSNSQFYQLTSSVRNLIQQINTASVSLSDYYTVLKIARTIPVMEKYQQESMPDKKEFELLLRQFNEIIKRTDELSNKK
jgi:hypothetical protein